VRRRSARWPPDLSSDLLPYAGGTLTWRKRSSGFFSSALLSGGRRFPLRRGGHFRLEFLIHKMVPPEGPPGPHCGGSDRVGVHLSADLPGGRLLRWHSSIATWRGICRWAGPTGDSGLLWPDDPYVISDLVRTSGGGDSYDRPGRIRSIFLVMLAIGFPWRCRPWGILRTAGRS